MKRIIVLLLVLLAVSTTFSQSSIVYDVGTVIEIGVNADVCADNIIINGGYIGTGRFCNGTVGVEDGNDIELPREYGLAQNYPNPFNSVTIISYQLPESKFVTLKVYDILGNEVEILVNEEKPAGSYNISFDASRFPSGVYYYKLSSGNYTETKKMILLK